MRWKSWPAWVKGGLIGCLILLIAIVSDFVFTGCVGSTSGGFCGILLIYFTMPVWFLVEIKLLPYQVYGLRYLILSFLLYFIIGALIGLIVGKIKSRKSKKK